MFSCLLISSTNHATKVTDPLSLFCRAVDFSRIINILTLQYENLLYQHENDN